MINVFYKNRNTIGQFMAALIFLGTFGFLFTFDGFVSKSEATSCCCSGEAVVTSFAADSSGDYGSDSSVDTSGIDGCCGGQDKFIPSSSSNNGGFDCGCVGGDPEGKCSCTPSSYCNGTGSRACPSDNPDCSIAVGVCTESCHSWCVIGGSPPCQGACKK